MALDPGVRMLLDALEALDRPKMSESTPDVAREGFRALTIGIRQPSMVIPVADASDITIDGGAHPIAARVYRPESSGPCPTVVFFHGGGFVIGDLDTHDNQARRLCRDTDSVVVSVDYRLAPENPWPAGIDDALAAAKWVGDHVGDLGGDADRIGLAGDSAGGNFAAVVAQLCRDAGAPAIKAQLLIYPAVDFAGTGDVYASRDEHAEGYFLTADDMQWFGSHYIGGSSWAPGGSGVELSDPRISPLHGNLRGLPAAVVVTAEYDPLRDEGLAYAAALADAGVPVTSITFPGLVHGFFDMAIMSPACAEAADRTCAEFGKLL